MRGERLLEHLAGEDATADLLLEHSLDEPLTGRRRIVKLKQQQQVQRVVYLRRRDAVQSLPQTRG